MVQWALATEFYKRLGQMLDRDAYVGMTAKEADLAARYGIVSPRGFGVDDLIEKAVQHTPAAVRRVQAQLPQGFPMEVAEPIFNGLLDAAQRLGRAFG